MDCDKEGADKYGDLFVWKSILKVAKEKNFSIIFVCNDIKEDWWNKDGDIPIEIRTELLDEFKEYNPFLNIYFVTLDRFFAYLSEELHIGNSKSALQLSAMDDAKLLVTVYKEEINIKIDDFLQAMDIVKEINEEFIEVGDKETYWEIESVSIEKEEKIITYYINLSVSILADLIFQEPGDYPYPAGKEAIDMNGKLVINKEEYATISNIVNFEIVLNEMRHIEPEVWNVIKNVKEGMSCKQFIKANDELEQLKKDVRNIQIHFDEKEIKNMKELCDKYKDEIFMLNKWQKWHYLAKIASGGFEDEKIEAYKY